MAGNGHYEASNKPKNKEFEPVSGESPNTEGLSFRTKVFLGISGMLISGVLIDRLLIKGRSVINNTIEVLYKKLKELDTNGKDQ